MAVVGIVGLGLIGGSLALDLVGSHDVRGYDPDAQCRRLAARAGVRIADHLRGALSGADLVVLCGPLAQLPATLETAATHWESGMIVTDVGGVKQPVVAAGRRHLPAGAFVGGHPMAGATDQGFAAARAGLFKDAPWALTPVDSHERTAAERVREILDRTRARFVEMDPQTHDLAVAFTSHLPYVLSAALVRAASGAQREGLEAIADLFGPGFRDATRLALTAGELGCDMAMQNRHALLAALAAFRHQLAQAEIMLGGDMNRAFLDWTEGARQWRSTL